MILDVSARCRDERKRLHFIATVIEEVELAELYRWAINCLINGKHIVTVSGYFLKHRNSTGVAQCAIVRYGKDDVCLTQTYSDNMSVLIDCSDFLVCARPLETYILNGSRRIGCLQLHLATNLEHSGLGIDGQCLERMRDVEVVRRVAGSTKCPVILLGINQRPTCIVRVI